MEFRILGPLEVWAGGVRVRLPGPRLERLLAALLLDAGRVVPLTSLADATWDESPPATVARQVQNLVAALRRTLVAAGASDEVIATERSGYLLQPGADELDAWRFERLVETARGLQHTDAAAGAAAMREALRLWRGDALAGLSGQSIRAGATYWDERRLAVWEECLALELDLGRHPQLVAELATLVDRHPFRENLTELLMLALYRCGRQSEALDAYQRLRVRLRDELGLDPGAAVRDLNEAILRRDPRLSPAEEPRRPATHTPVSARPAQLPADVATFTGRDWYLKALDALVTGDGEPRPVVISAIAGTAGIGKTALAVHWAHRAAALFPDGQLYVDLRGYSTDDPVEPADALAGFLRALGRPADSVPFDLAERASLFRSLLAERRVLVLLDNARSAEQVRPLLPGAPSCVVVVTSRNDLGGLVAIDDAHPMVLDALTPPEAVTLLGRIIGVDRVNAEPAEAAQLSQMCGGLPLALRIAAADLVARPARAIAEAVAALSAVDRLTGLAVPGDARATVRASIDLSYATLDEHERRLFRLLGVLPGRHITVGGVAALAGGTPEAANRVLDSLARIHLLDRADASPYGLHDLVRRYAADRAREEDSTADRAAAIDRWFEYCLDLVESAALVAYPHAVRLPSQRSGRTVDFADPEAALSCVDGELPNLVAATLSAARHNRPDVAWQLTDGLRNYFWYRRNPVDWITVANEGLSAAVAAGDLRAQGACEFTLGQAYICYARLRESVDHNTRAVALCRRAEWPAGEALAHNNLGIAYAELGRLRLAADHHRRGLEISERHGLHNSILGNLVNLGSLDAALGRLSRAAESFNRALALVRAEGNQLYEGNVLTNLGECEYRLGHFAAGLEHLTKALSLARSAGRPDALAKYLVAEIHCDAGRFDVADDYVRDALADIRQGSDNRTEAYVRTALARVHLSRGRVGEAFEQYARALQLAREIRSPAAESAVLLGKGWAHARTGAPRDAMDCAERVLALARAGEMRLREGEALVLLADAAQRQGDAEQSVAAAREALDVHEETGYRLGEALALHVLARATDSEPYRKRAAALFAELPAMAPEDVMPG